MFEWNNSPHRVTVASFYMDETEVRNLDYLEYLYWLNRVYATITLVYIAKRCPTHWFGVRNWHTMNPLWRVISDILLIAIILWWVLPGFRPMITANGEPTV